MLTSKEIPPILKKELLDFSAFYLPVVCVQEAAERIKIVECYAARSVAQAKWGVTHGQVCDAREDVRETYRVN